MYQLTAVGTATRWALVAIVLGKELEAEIVTRQRRSSSEREFLTRKLAKAEGEQRKLLDAYYGVPSMSPC